jgi:hypothetical protein
MKDINPTNQAETSIPVEYVNNGPNLNPIVTVRRKAAKRTELWYPVPQTKLLQRLIHLVFRQVFVLLSLIMMMHMQIP